MWLRGISGQNRKNISFDIFEVYSALGRVPLDCFGIKLYVDHIHINWQTYLVQYAHQWRLQKYRKNGGIGTTF